MDDGRDAQGAHGGEEHRAMEGADLQQELGDQAEVVQGFQEPHRELEEEPRQQGEELRGLVELGVEGRALDLLHRLIELAVDVIDRVGGLQVELDAGIRRVGGHLLFDGHAVLDIVPPGIDPLARQEAVQGRILGHQAAVGGDKHMGQAEVGQALPALFADVGLQLGDLQLVEDKIAGGGPVHHDVRHHHRHGRDGADPAAVAPVAPGGVIGPVQMGPDGQGRQQAAQEHQKVRQHPEIEGPLARQQRRPAVIAQDGHRRQEHQRHHAHGADMARGQQLVEDHKGQIDEDIENQIPKADSADGQIGREINRHQRHRHRGAVKMLSPIQQYDQGENQAGNHRQHNQKPHCPCICAFPAVICNAESCRTNHENRRQPGQHVFPADKIRHSLFHGISIPSFDAACKEKSGRRKFLAALGLHSGEILLK